MDRSIEDILRENDELKRQNQALMHSYKQYVEQVQDRDRVLNEIKELRNAIIQVQSIQLQDRQKLHEHIEGHKQ